MSTEWAVMANHGISEDGETALVLATKDSNNWDVVRALIRHRNVDLNVRGHFGYTVLMWATLKGKLDIVSILLKHDTLDTNLKNIAGSTALDIARNCEHLAIARVLQDNAPYEHGIGTIHSQYDPSPTKKMKTGPS
jgi:ankyrin repeat protein